MKNYICFFLFLMAFVPRMASQEIVKTSVKVSEITELFLQKREVQWAIPISQTERLPLKWSERQNSFTQKEGIRTFVGYKDDEFVATLSFSPKKNISGNFLWNDTQWIVSASEDGFLQLSKQDDEGKCGLCSDGSCHSHNHTRKPLGLSPMSKVLEETTDDPSVFSDGILRVYRLALAVDNSILNSHPFYGDTDKIKSFWGEVETFMNELYTRDLGIKIEVVNDDRLIVTDESKALFNYRGAHTVTELGTRKINELIGEESYDIGVVMTRVRDRGLLGLAGLYSAYVASTKGGAFSMPFARTIAHEVGHLFGSNHTFSTGNDSMKTEPGYGQSIMSYGNPRDFFSLASAYTIRKTFAAHSDYYEDKNRTKLVNRTRSENPVYGINTHNHSPIINRSKLKKEYTIPKQTYFQFDIPASDSDGDDLLYVAHQTDFRRHHLTSIAEFNSVKSSKNNVIAFGREYNLTGNLALKVGSTYDGVGEFTFWLGVNDTPKDASKIYQHATMYDIFATKLKIVEGTPFVIKNFNKETYSAGEKVTLTWDVDKTIFKDTKVRVLLSDDFGRTFKHILVPATENDGSCEIVMPQITVGETEYHSGDNVHIAGDGILKIEVIDHIAYTISNNNPIGGGFRINPSKITFKNLPDAYLLVDKESDIPAKANVQAETTCLSQGISIDYKEEKKDLITTRTWIAKDNCSNTATFVQHIEVRPKKESVEPLKFVGKLPESKRIACWKDFQDTQETLTIQGGKNPKIELVEVIRNIGYDNRYIERTWYGIDEVADPIMHRQMIVINDNQKPVLSAYPPDITVKSQSEVPYQETLTATDCGESVTVRTSRDEETVNGKKVIRYIWSAEDASGNYERHIQTITIDPDATTPAPTDLKFTKTPMPTITASCDAVPAADVSQFEVSGCASVQITHQDKRTDENCANSYTIQRIYTATGCDKSIEFVQTIAVKDEVKPVFVGSLPADTTAEEGAIPPQVDLTATDNCSASVPVVKTQETKEEGGKILIYKWEATDLCGNKAVYQQKITIKPKSQDGGGNSQGGGSNSQSGGDVPQDEIIIYNAVSTESGSENYFKIEPIHQFTHLSLDIYNELGQKVYQSNDYQRNGDIFRGYSNVNGVVGKGNRLPSGTYFYTLEYRDAQGIQRSKKGYLFVK